jgi:hypothetical protein
MIRKILTSTFGLAALTCASAQDSTKVSPFKFTGSADVYYRYNVHNPTTDHYNNYTSFTNAHNSFEIGMISLKAEHSVGKVSMVADVGFGQRAQDFSYNDDNTKFAVKQLYVTYAPSSKLKLTMGSWATHVGYEVVDAYMNRNYSMSYMFSYGPFFHTGIKGEYALSKKSTLMLGITNPSDLKSASGMPKTMIGQFATATKDDKLKLYLNFQGGKVNDSSRLEQGDVVINYALAKKFGIGFNATYQARQGKVISKWNDQNSWWGTALYLNIDPVPWFGLTLREEYLNDEKSVLGFDGNILATTLSANFKIKNLVIIPEVRLDNSSYSPGIFYKHDGTPTKSTGSFILAAVYSF